MRAKRRKLKLTEVSLLLSATEVGSIEAYEAMEQHLGMRPMKWAVRDHSWAYTYDGTGGQTPPTMLLHTLERRGLA